MPNVSVNVEWTDKKTFDETGIDNISFLFSANKKKTPMPVVEVASGGEISRLMLVIKSLIANNVSLPTIIFDEVDTGVSGEIADKMGDIMKDMSVYMQVVTISHLPQVAAKGNSERISCTVVCALDSFPEWMNPIIANVLKECTMKNSKLGEGHVFRGCERSTIIIIYLSV